MSDIRRVQQSSRQITPATSAATPASFGAGVGTALRSVAQATKALGAQQGQEGISEARLAKAQENRQTALELADARINWMRRTTQYGIESEELLQAEDTDLSGWTDQTYERAEKLREEFLGELSPRVQEQLNVETASFVEQQAVSAYSTQRTRENLVYKQNFLNAVQEFSNMLYEPGGENDPDAVAAIAEEKLGQLLAASPLLAPETEELRRTAENALSRALLYQSEYQSALNGTGTTGADTRGIRQENGLDVADSPVAHGLPKEAVALLDFIAGPESGGAYNRMYSGDDSIRAFDDYSQHPNAGSVITKGENAGKISTAAGRYQFINGTWQRVQENTGLADFSPESQDRGAWWLAQQDYTAKTGRDLRLDLASGDDAAYQRIIDTLAPTWEGLAGKNATELRGFLLRAQGTQSPLITDERFRNVPFGERLDLIETAQNRALQQASEQQAQFEQRQAAIFANIEAQIAAGNPEMTPSAIANLAEVNKFTPEEREKLIDQFEEKNKTGLAANDFFLKSQTGTYMTSEERKQGADAFMQHFQVGERIQQQDREFFTNVVVPTVVGSSYLPDGVRSQLLTMTESPDTEQALFAFDALAELQANAPVVLNGLGQDTLMNIGMFAKLRPYVQDTARLAQILQGSQDPAFAAVTAQNEKQFEQWIKDNPDYNSPSRIRSRLDFPRGGLFGGSATAMDGGKLSSIQSERNVLIRNIYSRTGDMKISEELADEVLQRTWGVWERGDEAFPMKYPPEKQLPTFNGTHDYVNQQFDEEFNDGRYELNADQQTQDEIAAGVQFPSYGVFVYREGGLIPDFARGKDSSVYELVSSTWRDALSPEDLADFENIEIRFRAQITPQMESNLKQDIEQRALDAIAREEKRQASADSRKRGGDRQNKSEPLITQDTPLVREAITGGEFLIGMAAARLSPLARAGQSIADAAVESAESYSDWKKLRPLARVNRDLHSQISNAQVADLPELLEEAARAVINQKQALRPERIRGGGGHLARGERNQLLLDLATLKRGAEQAIEKSQGLVTVPEPAPLSAGTPELLGFKKQLERLGMKQPASEEIAVWLSSEEGQAHKAGEKILTFLRLAGPGDARNSDYMNLASQQLDTNALIEGERKLEGRLNELSRSAQVKYNNVSILRERLETALRGPEEAVVSDYTKAELQNINDVLVEATLLLPGHGKFRNTLAHFDIGNASYEEISELIALAWQEVGSLPDSADKREFKAQMRELK